MGSRTSSTGYATDMNDTDTSGPKIGFSRAVYNTYNLVAGKRMEIHDALVDGVLPNADTALDSQRGFFFDTVDGVFVLGFEKQKRNHRSERFFDLYFMPPVEAATVRLTELVGGLQSFSMTYDEYQRLVDGDEERFIWDGSIDPPELDGTVPESERGAPGTGPTAGSDTEAPQDGGPSGDATPEADTTDATTDDPDDSEVGFSWDSKENTSDEPPDDHRTDGGPTPEIRLVAELYDRHRSGDAADFGAIPATLSELDTLVDLVDGVLPKISYVSPTRGYAAHFDFARGDREDTVAYESLVGYVQALHDEGVLEWAKLPSHREEVELEARRKTEQLSVAAAYEQPFAEAERTAERLLDDELADARDRLEAAVTDELEPPADDSGRFPSVSVSRLNPFGGDEDPSPAERNVSRVYAELDGDIALPDEQTEALAQHIAGVAAEELLESLETEVLESLEAKLRETTNDALVRLAADTIRQSDDVVRTRSYRRYQESELSDQ